MTARMCENVREHLVGTHKWPSNNRDVEFYINPNDPEETGEPNITEDVEFAANLWSDVMITTNNVIDLRFVHEGTTTRLPTWNDKKNDVGWD